MINNDESFMGIAPANIHRFATDMLNDPLYFSGAHNYSGLDAFREDGYGSKQCRCPCGTTEYTSIRERRRPAHESSQFMHPMEIGRASWGA